MAALWNMMREEFVGTVNEFREKGAVGAFRDAALDACDMVAGAGNYVMNEASTLIGGEEDPILYAVRLPEDGEEVLLRAGSRGIAAQVVALDTVSSPPRAKVRLADGSGVLVVPVLPMDVAMSQAVQQQKSQQINVMDPTTNANLLDDNAMMWVWDGLKSEVQSTVKDFREKGAVGALRDATLDAVDLLGTAGGMAVEGAKIVTDKTVDLLTFEDEPQPLQQQLPQQPTLQNSAPPPRAPEQWQPDQRTQALARDLDSAQDPEPGQPAAPLNIPAGAQQFTMADDTDDEEQQPGEAAKGKAADEQEELID